MKKAVSGEKARLEVLSRYHKLDALHAPLFQNIVRLAKHVCQVPTVLISLVDDKKQWFIAKTGLEADELPASHTICAIAIRDPDRLMVVEDAQQDPRLSDNPCVTGSMGLRFYAGVPLVDSDGFALGTLCVIDTVPRQLDSEQLHSLRTLANKVILHIETAWRLKQLEESEGRFLAFMDHAPALCFIKDRQGRYVYGNKAFLTQLGKTAEEFFGKDDFDLWPHSIAVKLRAHDLEVMLYKKAIKVVEYILLDDGTVGHWQVEKFLFGGDAFLGGIAVDVSQLKQTEEELQARQAWLEALSATDPLTGLKNRRAFDRDLEREWAFALRYGTQLSLLMMDLDHFKQVNDALGHDGGDRFLKSVALILKTDNRLSDLVARIGGEEFVMLLPNTGEEGARTLAERFRTEIEGLLVTTISIGIGVRTDAMLEAEALCKAADIALYQAKRSGRNRVAGPIKDGSA